MKKKIGYLLSLTMLGSMLPTAMPAGAANAQINIFDDFAQAVSVDTNADSSWTDPHGSYHGNISSYTDEDFSGKAMFVGSRAYDTKWNFWANQSTVRKFYGNYSDGAMHISFDTKMIADSEHGDKIGLTVSLFGSAPADYATEKNMTSKADGYLEEQYDYSVFKNPNGADPNKAYNAVLKIEQAEGAKNVTYYKNAWASFGEAVSSGKTISKDEVHKFDIIINNMENGEDGKTYDVYMDGEKISDGAYLSRFIQTDNFIGVAFQTTSDVYSTDATTRKGDGGYLIDNLYVESFKSESDVKGPQIKLNDGDPLARGGKLNLVFTEALSGVPAKSDFVIKNADGTAVTDYTVAADKTRAQITFGDSVSGSLTLSLNAAGAATGAAATGTVSFKIVSGENKVSETPFVFMNEDFNNYTGKTHGTYGTGYTNKYNDIPAGWYDADLDINTNPSANISDFNTVQDKYGVFWQRNGFMMNATSERFVVSEKRADGDYAMKLQKYGSDWGEGVRYFFPVGVCGGDFTMEFDVKHSGGGWTVGAIGYNNFDAIYAKQGGYNVGKTATELAYGANTALSNWASNKLLGMSVGSTELKCSNKISSAAAYVTTDSTAVKAADIAADTWTHVKVEFNTNTGKYNVTVTPENGTAQTYVWDDAARGRFEKGIKGIELTRLKGNEYVTFDNFKVYKADSYLVNDDFDDWEDEYEVVDSKDRAYMPGGWVVTGHQQTTYFSGDQAVTYMNQYNSAKAGSDQNNGKALEITGLGNDNILMRAFSRPTAQGAPFTVSFDIKTTGTAGWRLLLPNQSHLNYLPGFNQEATLADGKTMVYKARANWANIQSKCAVLSLYSGEENPRGDKSGLVLDNANANHEPKLEDITFEADTWYNYKVRVVPNTDGSGKVTVRATDIETGKTSEASYDLMKYHDNMDWYQWPAAGVGFTKNGGTGSVFIDNVRAYEESVVTSTYENEDEEIVTETVYTETEDVRFESVTDVRAEYMDGTSETLTNGDVIKPSVKRIAVEFSAPVAVAEADDVMQPANVIKTSRKILDIDSEAKLSDIMVYGGTENTTIIKDDADAKYQACAERYKVYDTVEDMITFRRLGVTSDAETADGLKFNKYFSDDKRTYYIDLNDKMFTDGVDYVLDVAENISFTSSVYARLDSGLTLKLGTQSEDAVKIYDMSFLRKAGNVWIDVKDAEEFKSLSAAEKTIKFVAKGYNDSADDYDLFAAFGQYGIDEDGASALNKTAADSKTINAGKTGTIEFEVSADAEKAGDSFKAFVWQQADMMPLADYIELK